MGTSDHLSRISSARLHRLAVVLLFAVHLQQWPLLHVKAQFTWVYDSVIVSSAATDIGFGRPIILSPDQSWLVVGAIDENVSNPASGAATVFSRGSGVWTQVAKLNAETPASNSLFSFSLAMTNSLLFVGSPYADSYTGRVTPFSWDGSSWNRGTEILGPASSTLGYSLTTDGTFLMAGAPYSGPGGNVIVYTLSGNNWVSSITLTGSTASGAQTGCFVVLGSGLVVSGACFENDKGSIYIWTISGNTVGTTAKRLTTSTAVDDYKFFGESIAILSDTVIAAGCSFSNLRSLCLFTFASSAWSQSSAIVDPSGTGIAFAGVVSYTQDYLLVGGYGTALLYSVTGSSLSATPTYLAPPSSETVSSGYGRTAVAISGTYAAVSDYSSTPLVQKVYSFNGIVPTQSNSKSNSKSKSISKSRSQSRSRTQSQSLSQSLSKSHSQSHSNSLSPVVKAVAPNNKSKSKNLGYKVAFGNNVAIVSVPFCFDVSVSCDGGFIHLFHKNITSKEWAFSAKVRNPFRNRDNKFGYNIHVRDDYLFVSAPASQYADRNVGIMIVYKWNPTTNTYNKESIIRYRKTDEVYALGVALSNFGTITAIGMPDFNTSVSLTSTGTVHAFKKQNTGKWKQRKTITAPTPQADERFGQSVSLHSETRIAISNNPTETSLQAVYIFDLVEDTWTWVQTIADTTKAGFGWNIKFFDDLLYIPAPNAGSISVYEVDAQGKYAISYAFQPETPVTGERFGFSFATDGTRFVVGTKPCDNDGVACGIKGSAYTFTKNSSNVWTQQYRYAIGAADGSDGFGFDVAVSGDTVLVAAPFKAMNTRDGVAYFIQK